MIFLTLAKSYLSEVPKSQGQKRTPIPNLKRDKWLIYSPYEEHTVTVNKKKPTIIYHQDLRIFCEIYKNSLHHFSTECAWTC
jgi:hypothetical protein